MNIVIAYTAPFGLTVKVFRDVKRWEVIRDVAGMMANYREDAATP